jgi:hypothetical protein
VDAKTQPQKRKPPTKESPMKSKSAICILLALISFAGARYHYVDKHSVTIHNPLDKSQSSTVGSHFFDKDIVGDWVKGEWIFAIAVPAVLLGAGVVLSTRK